jgi:tetratricopeptide (TPR) repeat protein
VTRFLSLEPGSGSPRRTKSVAVSDAVRQCRTSLLLLILTLPAAVAVAQPVPPPPGTSSDDPQEQKQELQKSPADGDALDVVESAIEAKNYTLASGSLDIFLSAHPGNARALFDRGYVEDAQDHHDAAEGWYRKAIAADPKQFEARLALGLLLAAKGNANDDQAARDQLQAAVQLQPNPPNPVAKAQADRALARLLRVSDPTGARDALVDALKLTSETPPDTLLAAEIAESAGDLEIAEQEYRQALRNNPEMSDASAGLAHLLIAEKRYADAQPLVEAALRRDPADPALTAQLATILNTQGKQAEALVLLEKLHKLQPDSHSVTSMLADADFQAGKLDEADALYQQLLAQSPNDPTLLDARGQILIRQERYPDAVAVFHAAIAARPDDIDAWSGIAFADSEAHQYQDELAALSMRSKYAQENPASLFLWATAYDNLHQTKQAADYYHRFLTAAQGKFPDQEWQAKHRLAALGK